MYEYFANARLGMVLMFGAMRQRHNYTFSVYACKIHKDRGCEWRILRLPWPNAKLIGINRAMNDGKGKHKSNIFSVELAYIRGIKIVINSGASLYSFEELNN